MTKMPLKIRRYVEADHARALELHILGLKQFDASSPRGSWDADIDDVERRYMGSGGDFLVGELDGEVVAIGGFWRKTKKMAELKRMRVDPKHQGRGYGQAVLTELESRARALGYSSMFLDTLSTMTLARHLYSKNGYVQTGTRGRAGSRRFCTRRPSQSPAAPARINPGRTRGLPCPPSSSG